MSSRCPVCGRVLCDHTPEERGVTQEQFDQEMDRELTPEEKDANWECSDSAKINAGRKALNDRYGKNWPMVSKAEVGS